MKTVNLMKLLKGQNLSDQEFDPRHEPGKAARQKEIAESVEASKVMQGDDLQGRKKIRMVKLSVTDQDTDDTRFSVPSDARFGIRLKE